MKSVSQLRRFVYLVIYLLIFITINYILFGTFLPSLTNKGFWFYTGLVSLIIGNFLVTPFYTNPANGLAYSTGALLAILFTSPNFNNKTFVLILSFIILLIILNLISIIFIKSKSEFWSDFSYGSKVLVEIFGNPIFIYIVILIYAVINFHSQNWFESFLIMSAGILLLLRFVERFDEAISKILLKIKTPSGSRILGKIEAYQTPNIVLVRVEIGEYIDKNSFLLINDSSFGIKLGISIGYTGRDENLLLRILELPVSNSEKKKIEQYKKRLQMNEVLLLPSEIEGEIRMSNEIDWSNFLGIIDVDSSIEHIFIEIINEQQVEEGRLIEAEIKGEKVLFQVLEGITIEDIVRQKNKYGYARAKARKIGKWSNNKKKFENVKWLPQINRPVFIKKKEDIEVNEDAIGIFPESNYYVTIKDIDRLVTHNTAILGILGVGKSMLSIEITERMIVKGIKVICIDLTNQYLTELSEFIDAKKEEYLINKIIESGKKDFDNCAENPEEGGSYPNIRAAIRKDIQSFLNNKDYYLKIYNPAIINGSRQYFELKSVKQGDDWLRVAGLWTITPVEITQIISEECLRLLQDKMIDKARACLVFEEAHTLIS